MISGVRCHRLVHFEWYEAGSDQGWELGDISSCERPGRQRFPPQGLSLAKVRSGCSTEACFFKKQHLLALSELLPTGSGSYLGKKKTALHATWKL